MPAGRDLDRPPPFQLRGEVAVQVGLQRTLVVDLAGEAGARIGEVVRSAGRRARVAAVEQQGHVGSSGGDLVEQDRQFLVRQVEAAGAPAVDTNKALVPSVGVVALERRRRLPPGTMAGIVEQHGVFRSRLAEVAAEGPDNVGARRISILEAFDGEPFGAEGGGEPGSQVIDVSQAPLQPADGRGIGVDPHEQCVNPVAGWHRIKSWSWLKGHGARFLG